MKVTINEKQTEGEVKYPCLMKYKTGGFIISVSEIDGDSERYAAFIVEKGNSGFKKGMTAIVSKIWLDGFVPFKGSITLEND